MPANYTIHHVRGHHLRFDQRETIAIVYNANLRLPPGRRKSQNQLARELGLAKSTFSREISGGRGGLLVLTERKTRYTLIEKVKALSQDEIVAAIRRLARRRALKHVRSITTDNGGEFADCGEMRRALRRVNRFLKIYYAHAYAAWEKGSVENVNRHIRRFFPKGTRFNLVSRNRIKELQDFINPIPRTSQKGKSAHESFLLVR